MLIFKRVLRIVSYVILSFCLIGLIFCSLSSDKLDIVEYKLENKGVDFSCLVISDYHHRSLNFSNGSMIEKIKEQGHVNSVFFTGDIIDSHTNSLDDVYQIFEVSNEISDHMFYVTGNHEDYAPLWSELLDNLNNHGVILLDNKVEEVSGCKLYGIEDPHSYYHKGTSFNERKEYLKKTVDEMEDLDTNKFNILLVHRPECAELYVDKGFDLVVCGHTHGGQFKIGNWIPSSIALEDNRFMGGEYQVDNTKIVVSRGLGYSAMFPLRINCNPEIIKITVSK